MKKLLLIIFASLLCVLFISVSHSKVYAAAGDGKGYVNIFGHSFVDPACDPDKTDCSSDHPFAKNCNTQSKSCSSTSVDIPSDIRPIWRFVCDGQPANRQCGSNGTNNNSTGSMSIGNPGCGKTVQLDAYAPGKGPGTEALDYLVYYTGDCAAPTVTQSPTTTQSPTSNPTSNPTTNPTSGPTSTVTQPPSSPSCGSSCSSNQDCARASNGCTSCISGSCQSAPTPTPTPAFNTAMCQCDGTQVSSLIPGVKATVTANYKIVGEDQSKATMTSVKFVMYEGDNTSGKIVAQSSPIPVKITSINNDRTQYQAVWTFTVPTNVDPKIVYRVTTQSDCKASGLSQTSISLKQEVAGVSTGLTPAPAPSTSFFGRLINFFKRLVGFGNTAATTSTTSSTPTPAPSKTTTASEGAEFTVQGNQIQLGTFQPATVLPQTACNIIRFQFSTP